MWVVVQRSPFLTQSVALKRSRRLLVRVIDDHIIDSGPVSVGQDTSDAAEE
jgi:hypothetical protein